MSLKRVSYAKQQKCYVSVRDNTELRKESASSDKYPFPQTSHNRTYKSIHGVYGTPLNAAWALEAAYWKKCSVGITVEFCKL